MDKIKLKEIENKKDKAKEEYEKAIKQFQDDCKHEIESWHDYCGKNEQCKKCKKWF